MRLLLARYGWHRSARSYVALGLVTFVTISATLATLLGASRSRTAFARLRASTRATDVILRTEAMGEDPPAERRRVARLPGVAATSFQAEMFVTPDYENLFPDYSLYAFAPVPAAGGPATDVPIVDRGRRADPRRADEVMLSGPLARSLHLHLGDTFTLHTMTDAFVERLFNGERPSRTDGPEVKVRLVGVVRSPSDFSRFRGVVFLTPAFYDRYRDQVRVYSSVAARLDATTRRQVRDGRPPHYAGYDVGPAPFADTQATDDGLGTISTALWLLGLAIALAGAGAIAIAALRLARGVLQDRTTLSALGATRRQMVEGVVTSGLPWLLAATAMGTLGGMRASPLALVGLAKSADPRPHALVVDGPVLTAAVSIGLVYAVCALVVAALLARPPRPRSMRRPALSLPVRQPLAPILGARLALGEGQAPGGRASRGSLVAAALGVSMAVAALVVGASIHHLQTDPSLFGSGRDRLIDSGESPEIYDRALPALEADHRASLVAGIHVLFGLSPAGHETPTLAYDVRRGVIDASITRGRMPRGADEVAMGPATLDELRLRVGDRVRVDTEKTHASYRIVGALLFPEGDFQHDKGMAMTTDASDRLVGNTHDAAAIHQILFNWRDGVDASRADADLRRAGLSPQTDAGGIKPAVVTNLGQVERLPRYLAGFLAVVALVSLAHALGQTVRLRGRQFGTLRALGATRAVSAGIILFQSMTIVAVAIVVGAPTGIAVGRGVWRSIAERAHVVVEPAVPRVALLAVGIGLALVSAVLTVLPAWRAARLRPSEILRAE